MSRGKYKRIAIAALRSRPDYSRLRLLNETSPRERLQFLRWLDHSGLALYFFARLRDARELQNLQPDLRDALGQRYQSNAVRMRSMFADFWAVNAAFRAAGIPHAFLKGFALIPDFCSEMALRHQSDLDILVAPESLFSATQALEGCGYQRLADDDSLEFSFATPLQRVPNLHDDIYQTPPCKEVELRTSIWNDVGRVSLQVPQDCLARSRESNLQGTQFTSLCVEDTFLMQVLHAFGHLLGSWLRVSWLWEIHYFVEEHGGDGEFWRAFQARAGADPRLRRAIGLVVGLTAQLFDTRLPESVRIAYVDSLPERIHAWILHCGAEWALSDISGSKLTLFIHREFFDESQDWSAYLLRRIVPMSQSTSARPSGASDVKSRVKARLVAMSFTMQRLIFHASEALRLAWETIRWKQFLHSSRRQRAASS